MILQELNRLLFDFVKAQSLLASKKTLFRNFDKYNFVKLIYQSLNLNDFMTIRDLEDAIKLIEKLPVFSEDYPTLHQLISLKLDHPVLNQINNNAGCTNKLPDFPKVKLGITSNFTKTLIEVHQLLLIYYQKASTHALGQTALKEINYDSLMLTQSQAFHDLSISTRELISSDNSTIIPDVRRKGVTFYRANIIPSNYSDTYNVSIIQAIKNFTGDNKKIDQANLMPIPGSKASKILNFGGQFLEAIVLNEFTNSIEFANKRQGRLERGKVKGHINWSKNNDTNEIFATVNIDIYTFSFADDDINKGQEFYAISSDGETLLPIPMNDFERVFSNCDNERLDKTENNLVPICEYSVKIKLDSQYNSAKVQEYFFKVEQCTLKINTSQLTCTKEKAHSMSPRFNPSTLPTSLM